MGYRFKRKESVQHGLRRIARECIDAAIEAMRHSHRGDAIHCVRKDIKKLRAMLRMAQPFSLRKTIAVASRNCGTSLAN